MASGSEIVWLHFWVLRPGRVGGEQGVVSCVFWLGAHWIKTCPEFIIKNILIIYFLKKIYVI